MEVFALEYYKNNKASGVFKTEDGAYILSFSIMMLHTSLHNPSVKSRTSKKQWITMNRGGRGLYLRLALVRYSNQIAAAHAQC